MAPRLIEQRKTLARGLGPVLAVACLALLAVRLFALPGCTLFDRSISRDKLVEDVERLAWIIQDAHPAP